MAGQRIFCFLFCNQLLQVFQAFFSLCWQEKWAIEMVYTKPRFFLDLTKLWHVWINIYPRIYAARIVKES